MKLYEHPVAELMVEAADQAEYPTSRGDLVAWFAERYPQVKASTVRAHVTGLTDNDRNRHHYASLAKREAVFTRNPDGSLSRFEGDAEEPIHEPDDGAEGPGTPPLEFALELFLEQFLLTNWGGIDWGRPLELWESETGDLGHQLKTRVGRLDFLCHDTETNALVVVELKRGRPSDRVVGQAARYMGWIRQHLAAEGQQVEGLIVAHEQDIQLAYAVSSVPNLSVLTYSVDFTLSAPGDASHGRSATDGRLADRLRRDR